MRSKNPVFTRSETFGASTGIIWPVAVDGERMTVDGVVRRTAVTLAVIFASATAAWWWVAQQIGTDSTAFTSADMSKLFLVASLSSGLAFVLSLVNSFKKVISPPLVLAFAAVEGIALGLMSKVIDAVVSDGAVSGAVLGTFGAFAGTLAAYRFFNIKVSEKFRSLVIAGMFGMVALGLMSFGLSLFGVHTGLFGISGAGTITAVVGLVLGVFLLILDFDYVEKGVAAGKPAREGWRVAFGLSVSLVWIYTDILRLLAAFAQD